MDKVKINLSQEEITSKYGSNIEAESTEETHQMLARLYKYIGGISKIVHPGDFSSALDSRAKSITCSVKASQGNLFPMKSSLIFI